eukprot:SAG11_NODE_697_length_7684_cov_8.250231_3_plen_38_part_00
MIGTAGVASTSSSSRKKPPPPLYMSFIGNFALFVLYC